MVLLFRDGDDDDDDVDGVVVDAVVYRWVMDDGYRIQVEGR